MTVAALTPEDLASIRAVTDVDVSADGRTVAAVVHEPAPLRGHPPRSAVWVSRDGQPAQPVTDGPGLDLLARVSPTGRWLAFASDRIEAGLWRLYVVPIGSDPAPPGGARPVEALPGVVEDIVWADDESGLMVRTADEGSDTGNIGGGTRFVPAGEAEAPFLVKRPAQEWRRLHWVELGPGQTAQATQTAQAIRVTQVTQVNPDGLSVWEIGWAGHGPVAAVVSADPSENGWYDAQLALIDPATRTASTVYEPRWQLQSPALSPDGTTLAFLEAPQSDRALLAGAVVILNLADGSIVRPEYDVDVTRLRWTDDGRLFWAGVASVETACGFLVPDTGGSAPTGWRFDEQWRGRCTLGRTYLVGATCSRSGDVIAASVQAHNRPPELNIRTPRVGADDEAGDWQALTAVNAELAGRSVARESVHRWKAGDGWEIHGLLLLPPGEPPAGGFPLVVVAHGGPTNASTSAYASGAHRGDALLLTQVGCAVLLPNFRGSVGRGLEFMAANIGDMGGGDLADIEAGVASLVEAGLVDAARVGIIGLSYGGFMSAWAAVRSSAFAASIPISGLMNWLSFHNTSNVGRFDEIYLDADPYDLSGPYLERSPVMYVKSGRTPTLLLHGDIDLACPLGQAQEFYHGLASAGCDTELVTYRGAGHGMSEREHVIDVSNRILGWFGRHLGLELTPNEGE